MRNLVHLVRDIENVVNDDSFGEWENYHNAIIEVIKKNGYVLSRELPEAVTESYFNSHKLTTTRFSDFVWNFLTVEEEEVKPSIGFKYLKNKE
jgi:hypothetical protein